MEEILQAAGVTIESEAVAQKNAISERIRRSVVHSSKGLTVPKYSDVPMLSSLNMQRLLNEVKNEIDSSRGAYPKHAIAVMKFRYLESLLPKLQHAILTKEEEPIVEQSSAPLVEQSSVPIIEQTSASHISLDEKDGLLQGTRLTPVEPGYVAFVRDNSSHAVKKRRQILNESIQNIYGELESVPLARALSNQLRSHSSLEMQMTKRDNSSKKKSTASRNRSSSKTRLNSNSNIATVHCPVCDSDLPVGSMDAAAVLDNHIDRCGRRTTRRSTRATTPSYISDKPLIENDFVDFDESSDDGSRSDRSYRLSISEESDSERSIESFAPEEDEKPKRSMASPSFTPSKRQRSVNVEVLDDWIDDVYVNRTLEADTSTICTPHDTLVNRTTWDAMYEYQRDGVKWLWDHYTRNTGGILGDEMGLGKSCQLCAHFASIAYRHKNSISSSSGAAMFLIVAPATVLHHWLDELNNWSPELRVVVMHSISPFFKDLQQHGIIKIDKMLSKLRKRTKGGVVIVITYDGLRKYRKSLLLIDWTAVCLDEGQKIRNTEAEITTVCKLLISPHRIILSGTPIQNNLRELWSLFDFVFPGRLGTMQGFESNFAIPIRMGGYSNASKYQAEIAIRTATTLQRAIRPHLLRRRKCDLETVAQLPKKIEQVVFCKLSPAQRNIYTMVLASNEVKAAIRRRAPAFRALMTLRKLCNHPILAFRQGKVVWSENSDLPEGDTIGAPEELSSESLLWEDSGKLLVLSKLLPLWHKEGQKVLVFSQTQSMLNLIEVMLRQFSFNYLRMDGSTPVARREGLVRKFNTDDSIFLMLLTTQTGGVGISLVAANRVVLTDTSWNPQVDNQARERAWRIGQVRSVTILRLITKGTIEEKMYQRQIFKMLMTNRILENPKQKRLFSVGDLKELFELGPEFNSDLPLEGEIDIMDESPQQNENVSSEQNRSTPSPAPSSGSRDRRLLEALFNGDAVSGVYDHSYFESSSNGVDNDNSSRVDARQHVDEVMRRMSRPTPAPKFGHASSAATSSAPSSAMLLANLKALNTDISSSDATRSTTPTISDTEVATSSNVLQDLKSMFELPGSAYTTQEIINHFGDLSDDIAPIFREMLRRVAKFKDGIWSRNSEFFLHS